MAVSFVYLVACLSLLNYRTRGARLSKEELDLNKQYQQFLKRPSVKTIKTENGGLYDCVDFYTQPVFDHPLMKNHTFHPQMRPNYRHEGVKATSSNNIQCQILKLEDGGCPTGTVPIKRVSKDDFIQIKNFTKDYASRRRSNSIQSEPGYHFAVIQTNSDPRTTKYHGARGVFNVYKLSSIGTSRYSSGEMIIQNENDIIKVGWTVNPTLNQDNSAHLFQYLSAGDSHCFNTLCSGFVSINKDIPIDSSFIDSSKRGGVQKIMSLYVYQDSENKSWWLELCGVVVGFWPQQIFTAMADGATYIAVGGEAYGPPDQPLPPMGNGYYPSEELTLSAFVLNYTVLDANHQHINPQQTEKYTTEWKYGVYDMGIYKNHGRTICYGGTTL